MNRIIALNTLILLSYTNSFFAMDSTSFGWSLAKTTFGYVANNSNIHRAIATRTDTILQEKMTGMQPDPMENAKTTRVYDAVRKSFCTLTQEEFNLYTKRLNIGLPLAHAYTQLAFFKDDLSAHERKEITDKLERFIEFNKGVIPQAIIEQINTKLKEIPHANAGNNRPLQHAYNLKHVTEFVEKNKLNESEEYKKKQQKIDAEFEQKTKTLEQERELRINTLKLEIFEKYFSTQQK